MDRPSTLPAGAVGSGSVEKACKTIATRNPASEEDSLTSDARGV